MVFVHKTVDVLWTKCITFVQNTPSRQKRLQIFLFRTVLKYISYLSYYESVIKLNKTVFACMIVFILSLIHI